jgi:hypothetical protein
MLCIKLSRYLLRRPPLKSLVGAGIFPRECCGYDRRSGEIVWGTGVAGSLLERKRKVEREQIKEGLRVWLERKAREIRVRSAKKREFGVGTLVWRFSRKLKISSGERDVSRLPHQPSKDKVSGLKRFFEDMAS